MRPLYVSGTVQDSGKTSVTLGLIQILRQRGLDIGYIKPVGQHYVRYQDKNIDEDAVLIHEALGFTDPPYNMSPIAIERGFTRAFIDNPEVSSLEKQIHESMDYLGEHHDFVLVEGTGHAGVGSCFGLSNARVAELTGSDVVIVTAGGIGKPIDEVELSLALFAKHNVNVLGVILNKVRYEKLDQVRDYVGRGLKILGTRLLGAIPYDTTMRRYKVKQIAEAFNYRIINGGENLDNYIENVVVAAMAPQNALRYFQPHSLVITPGDRIDNILLTLTLSGSEDYSHMFNSGALILTGGLEPDKTILQLLKKSKIPVLMTEEDTYTVTARTKDLEFKIQTYDTEKIDITRRLVGDYCDIDSILELLK